MRPRGLTDGRAQATLGVALHPEDGPMAKISRINPDGVAKPFANYSHVVTAEGVQKLVFCAGQVAADADGKVLPPTISTPRPRW